MKNLPAKKHKRKRRRKQEKNYRSKGLYNSKTWKKLRTNQLMEEPFCQECSTDDKPKLATEVDHIKPHKGDEFSFFDSDNLQSLCKICHSRKTAKEQQSLYELLDRG